MIIFSIFTSDVLENQIETILPLIMEKLSLNDQCSLLISIFSLEPSKQLNQELLSSLILFAQKTLELEKFNKKLKKKPDLIDTEILNESPDEEEHVPILDTKESNLLSIICLKNSDFPVLKAFQKSLMEKVFRERILEKCLGEVQYPETILERIIEFENNDSLNQRIQENEYSLILFYIL